MTPTRKKTEKRKEKREGNAGRHPAHPHPSLELAPQVCDNARQRPRGLYTHAPEADRSRAMYKMICVFTRCRKNTPDRNKHRMSFRAPSSAGPPTSPPEDAVIAGRAQAKRVRASLLCAPQTIDRGEGARTSGGAMKGLQP